MCYFAHDSTLASFYYAYKLGDEPMPNATFCSYYAIECTPVSRKITFNDFEDEGK